MTFDPRETDSKFQASNSASHWKLLRGSAGEERDKDSILKLMDSQTEVCFFQAGKFSKLLAHASSPDPAHQGTTPP